MQGMQETRDWSLGREDPLEKEVATHFWKIPWTEETGGLRGHKASDVAKHST